MKQLITAAKLSLSDLGAVRGYRSQRRENEGGSGTLPWVTSNLSLTSLSSLLPPVLPSCRLLSLSPLPLSIAPCLSPPVLSVSSPLPPSRPLSFLSLFLYGSPLASLRSCSIHHCKNQNKSRKPQTPKPGDFSGHSSWKNLDAATEKSFLVV